jgi:hypothetical protein
MWKLFGSSDQESELQKARKRQEQLLHEQLAEIGIENEVLRKWKKDQETQEGLVNAVKLKKEKEQQQQLQKEEVKSVPANGESTSSNGDASQQASNNQQQQQQQTREELSYVEMARLGYQELVNAIIRPPRATYEVRPIHHF